ncbi:hypothetical protein ACFIOY_00145 [Bradyrhizobium sp. TZ2]
MLAICQSNTAHGDGISSSNRPNSSAHFSLYAASANSRQVSIAALANWFARNIHRASLARFYLMARFRRYYPKVQVNLSAEPARLDLLHDSVRRRLPSLLQPQRQQRRASLVLTPGATT